MVTQRHYFIMESPQITSCIQTKMIVNLDYFCNFNTKTLYMADMVKIALEIYKKSG